MSIRRSCLPCRTAKTKCDFVRPICGRCVQRQLPCSGFPSDSDYIFLNENEVARRNSKRARGESSGECMPTGQPDIVRPCTAQSQDVQASIASISPHLHQVQSSIASISPHLQQWYYWLNDRALAQVSAPLSRDLETRAVDRFFVNWTLHPSNSGISPGYMHYLPILYLSTSPASLLWLAVRAVAFADMRSASNGGTLFSITARRQYGAALKLMRMLVEDELAMVDDHVLAAILLIDNFELMYLGRVEPLGAHNSAVKYILHARGDDQLYNKSRFALWQVANHRLQARQILLREAPDTDQIAWLDKLNINSPDIRISADVLRMNILIVEAKKLTQRHEDTNIDITRRIEELQQLSNGIRCLIASMEVSILEVLKAWKPKTVDPGHIMQPRDIHLAETSTPSFPCPRMLTYHDIWLAYMWNFHAASQIVLRESLIKVITYNAGLQMRLPHVEETSRIWNQRQVIETLSSTIIRSFPPLLGMVHETRSEAHSTPNGQMAGRFFALFSMWVIRRADYTSPIHKETARKVIEWINTNHGLD